MMQRSLRQEQKPSVEAGVGYKVRVSAKIYVNLVNSLFLQSLVDAEF